MIIEKKIEIVGSKGREEVTGLFDSGATYSCIEKELAERLGMLDEIPVPLPFETAKKGESVKVKERVCLDFHLNGYRFSDEFMVLPELSEKLIIGASTMQKWRFKLDFEHEEVIIDPRVTRLRLLKAVETESEMILEKVLRVSKISVQNVSNAPYEIEGWDPELYGSEKESTVTLTEEMFKELNIDLNKKPFYKSFRLRLEARTANKEKPKDAILISSLENIATTHFIPTIPPSRHEETKFIISLRTPHPGGTLVLSPCPRYELTFCIDEEQYEKVKSLPPNTVFELKEISFLED